ncbi:MAG: hypothetical protein HW387_1139 [Parachlamydiales bacterium]|nr:hypothetical protein [Parachlamydiales bacterium]
MIVKNEQAVIRRCLETVKPIIDYWVIVDTGSWDNTRPIIQDCLKDIPGELHESAWVNFAHNRNIALGLAKNKSDYILFIDADETLLFYDSFDKNRLDKDFYFALKTGQRAECQCALLIRSDPGWRWEGVIHEYITHSHPMVGDVLNELAVDCSHKEGHRSQDSQKALNDAQMLEEALKKDPDNGRYVFYLAQSYANAKKHDRALENYKKRVSMGGNEDEIFWSLYCIASIQEYFKMDFQTIVDGYCQAYCFKPSRAEPLYRLAAYFQTTGHPLMGYLTARLGTQLPIPRQTMKLQKWIYDYGFRLKHAELSHAIGHREEALRSFKTLLAQKECPESVKKEIVDFRNDRQIF